MTCFGRKSAVLPGIFQMPKFTDNFWGFLALEGGRRQTVGIKSTFGVGLKYLGYNDSNELCGRLVASKLSVREPD